LIRRARRRKDSRKFSELLSKADFAENFYALKTAINIGETLKCEQTFAFIDKLASVVGIVDEKLDADYEIVSHLRGHLQERSFSFDLATKAADGTPPIYKSQFPNRLSYATQSDQLE
jgi:hypothetical protein